MLNALASLQAPKALLQLLSQGNILARCQDEVRYTIAPSSFGPVLFAISHGRIVSLELGRDVKELMRHFKVAFPHSREAKGDPVFWDAGVEVLRAIENVDLPDELEQTEIASRFTAAVRSMLYAREGQPVRYALPAFH